MTKLDIRLFDVIIIILVFSCNLSEAVDTLVDIQTCVGIFSSEQDCEKNGGGILGLSKPKDTQEHVGLPVTLNLPTPLVEPLDGLSTPSGVPEIPSEELLVHDSSGSPTNIPNNEERKTDHEIHGEAINQTQSNKSELLLYTAPNNQKLAKRNNSSLIAAEPTVTDGNAVPIATLDPIAEINNTYEMRVTPNPWDTVYSSVDSNKSEAEITDSKYAQNTTELLGMNKENVTGENIYNILKNQSSLGEVNKTANVMYMYSPVINYSSEARNVKDQNASPEYMGEDKINMTGINVQDTRVGNAQNTSNKYSTSPITFQEELEKSDDPYAQNTAIASPQKEKGFVEAEDVQGTTKKYSSTGTPVRLQSELEYVDPVKYPGRNNSSGVAIRPEDEIYDSLEAQNTTTGYLDANIENVTEAYVQRTPEKSYSTPTGEQSNIINPDDQKPPNVNYSYLNQVNQTENEAGLENFPVISYSYVPENDQYTTTASQDEDKTYVTEYHLQYIQNKNVSTPAIVQSVFPNSTEYLGEDDSTIYGVGPEEMTKKNLTATSVLPEFENPDEYTATTINGSSLSDVNKTTNRPYKPLEVFQGYEVTMQPNEAAENQETQNEAKAHVELENVQYTSKTNVIDMTQALQPELQKEDGQKPPHKYLSSPSEANKGEDTMTVTNPQYVPDKNIRYVAAVETVSEPPQKKTPSIVYDTDETFHVIGVTTNTELEPHLHELEEFHEYVDYPYGHSLDPDLLNHFISVVGSTTESAYGVGNQLDPEMSDDQLHSEKADNQLEPEISNNELATELTDNRVEPAIGDNYLEEEIANDKSAPEKDDHGLDPQIFYDYMDPEMVNHQETLSTTSSIPEESNKTFKVETSKTKFNSLAGVDLYVEITETAHKYDDLQHSKEGAAVPVQGHSSYTSHAYANKIDTITNNYIIMPYFLVDCNDEIVKSSQTQSHPMSESIEIMGKRLCIIPASPPAQSPSPTDTTFDSRNSNKTGIKQNPYMETLGNIQYDYNTTHPEIHEDSYNEISAYHPYLHHPVEAEISTGTEFEPKQPEPCPHIKNQEELEAINHTNTTKPNLMSNGDEVIPAETNDEPAFHYYGTELILYPLLHHPLEQRPPKNTTFPQSEEHSSNIHSHSDAEKCLPEIGHEIVLEHIPSLQHPLENVTFANRPTTFKPKIKNIWSTQPYGTDFVTTIGNNSQKIELDNLIPYASSTFKPVLSTQPRVSQTDFTEYPLKVGHNSQKIGFVIPELPTRNPEIHKETGPPTKSNHLPPLGQPHLTTLRPRPVSSSNRPKGTIPALKYPAKEYVQKFHVFPTSKPKGKHDKDIRISKPSSFYDPIQSAPMPLAPHSLLPDIPKHSHKITKPIKTLTNHTFAETTKPDSVQSPIRKTETPDVYQSTQPISVIATAEITGTPSAFDTTTGRTQVFYPTQLVSSPISTGSTYAPVVHATTQSPYIRIPTQRYPQTNKPSATVYRPYQRPPYNGRFPASTTSGHPPVSLQASALKTGGRESFHESAEQQSRRPVPTLGSSRPRIDSPSFQMQRPKSVIHESPKRKYFSRPNQQELEPIGSYSRADPSAAVQPSQSQRVNPWPSKNTHVHIAPIGSYSRGSVHTSTSESERRYPVTFGQVPGYGQSRHEMSSSGLMTEEAKVNHLNPSILSAWRQAGFGSRPPSRKPPINPPALGPPSGPVRPTNAYRLMPIHDSLLREITTGLDFMERLARFAGRSIPIVIPPQLHVQPESGSKRLQVDLEAPKLRYRDLELDIDARSSRPSRPRRSTRNRNLHVDI